MHRIVATFHDVCQSFMWTKGVASAMDVLKPVFGLVALLVGPAALAADLSGLFKAIGPFTFYLIVVSMVYLTWITATAWERNGGPIISFGKPEEDKNFRLLQICVRNNGSGEVAAKAFAQNMRDKNGNLIPRIDDEIELHWRGYNSDGKPMTLHSNKPGSLAIVQNKETTDGSVACFVIPDAFPNYRVIPVIPDQPFPDEVRFEVRIDFFMDGKRVKSRSQRYSLAADSTSPVGYRLTPLR